MRKTTTVLFLLLFVFCCIRPAAVAATQTVANQTEVLPARSARGHGKFADHADASFFTDVRTAPDRLAQLKAAGIGRRRDDKWGFENAKLEPWDFGHPAGSRARVGLSPRQCGFDRL
jgi:hypothetical protein